MSVCCPALRMSVQRYLDRELALADVCAEVSAVCILYPGTEGDLQLVQSQVYQARLCLVGATCLCRLCVVFIQPYLLRSCVINVRSAYSCPAPLCFL